MRAASGLGKNSTWQAVEKYARAGSAGKSIVNDFLGQLGPVGKILGSIVGKGSAPQSNLPSNVQNALDFIQQFADDPSVISALERILQGKGAQAVEGSGFKPRTPAGKLAEEIAGAIKLADIQKGGSGNSGRGGGSRPPGGGRGAPGDGGSGGGDDGKVPVNLDGQIVRMPKDHPLVTGEMIETPQSSNVYAFGFDNDSHSLFVRFKDSKPSTGGGHTIKGVYGGSGGGAARPHKPGPLYLYHNTPGRLFLSFIDASSKGNWVWDHLRIRGTVSGHQLDYALVGVQGGYVPRKATLTAQGEEYIPRTIFTDKGRPLSSSLPQELVRPLQPGYPKMGRPPNDGRNGLGGRR